MVGADAHIRPHLGMDFPFGAMWASPPTAPKEQTDKSKFLEVTIGRLRSNGYHIQKDEGLRLRKPSHHLY